MLKQFRGGEKKADASSYNPKRKQNEIEQLILTIPPADARGIDREREQKRSMLICSPTELMRKRGNPVLNL